MKTLASCPRVGFGRGARSQLRCGGKTALVALCVSLLATRPLRAQSITKDVVGKLVALSGNVVVPQNDKTFGLPKYVALYFGAGWCGPCHKFTPALVEFYKEMKPKHPEFEVIFVSEDMSAPEMQQYMSEMKMPWPAIRYDAIKFSPGLTKFGGSGIPCLVLLDANEQVLSHSYQGGRYVGPQKVLEDLRKVLEQGAPPAVAPSAASVSASPATVTGTPHSPTGTKWDEVFKKRSP